MMLVRDEINGRAVDSDPVHARLKKAVEKKVTSYLWVPGDTRPFKPAVLPLIYGDGRALFALTTINQRPRFWLIRGCSTWGCGDDDRDSPSGPDFGDITDHILSDLEEAFGRGRCGHSGNSLFWRRRDRIANCQCEECSDRYVARWPEVDDYGGCSWGRRKWPSEFKAEPHPLSPFGNLLAE